MAQTFTQDSEKNSLRRLDNDGHQFLYTLAMEDVPGFTTEVVRQQTGTDKLTFVIRNTWVGDDYVNVIASATRGLATGSRTD